MTEEPLDYYDWKSIFGEVGLLFKGEEFKSVVTEIPITRGDEKFISPAYITPYFLLLYHNGTYYISFTINKYKIETVSHYTHILTLLLYDRLEVWEDNWVDVSNGMIYFGDDAYHKYEENDMAKHGVTKCPCCEKIVPVEFIIDELGYCKICENMVIPNATFH